MHCTKQPCRCETTSLPERYAEYTGYRGAANSYAFYGSDEPATEFVETIDKD